MVEAEDNTTAIDKIKKQIDRARSHYDMGDKHSRSETDEYDKNMAELTDELNKLTGKGKKPTPKRQPDHFDPANINKKIAELEAQAKEMEKTLPPKFQRGSEEDRLKTLKYSKVKGDIIILQRALKR